MIKRKKIICLIPAKEHSTGLKNKNILPLNKKPVIFWTFKAAKESKYIDNIMVSTDSKYIFNLSKKNKLYVPFLRPRKLATFKSSIFDVIVHAKKYFDKIKKYDLLILLQPTSPFRTSTHIDSALKKFVNNSKKDKKKLVSVYEVEKKFNWMYTKKNNKFLQTVSKKNKKTKNRQDANNLYMPNGAIFIYDLKNFKNNFFLDKVLFFLMDKKTSIDIDTKQDYKLSKLYSKTLK